MNQLNIQYFKKIKKNKPLLDTRDYPDVVKYVPEGCTLEEIEELQKKCNVRFPKAYVEFLYLAGKNHRLYPSGYDSEYEILEEIQEAFELEMKDSNIKVDRPIWAIDMLNGDQFAFFYLDEESENPLVYGYLNFDEEVAIDFNEVVHCTDETVSRYFESFVTSKLGVLFTRVALGIGDIVNSRFFRK